MKLNLANRITLIRVFLTPVVIFFYLANFIPYNILIATIIFIIAINTDYIDGYIARSRNMVTNLGKFLDTLADKLIVTSAIILVSIDQILPAPYGAIFAIVIIGRELLVSGLRQIAAANNIVIAADKYGKIKAIFQDITVPLMMILAQVYKLGYTSNLVNVVEIITYVLAGITVVLTVYSAINYIVKNKSAIKQ